MAIRFIVDSGADILPREAENWGITHVPLKVMFGQTEYRDAVDLSHREFYEKLIECDDLPRTSQIPPAEFEDIFRRVADAGDTAVVVTMSSGCSGTYQSACIAASEFEGIYVVDSKSVSLGTRILVQRGLQLRADGLSGKEIAGILTQETEKLRVLALLDTLEYLKRGGRISAATALAGSLLSIKPVVTVEDGQVVMAGKARGSKQGNNLLRELIAKCGGIDFSKPICLAYSGLSDAMLQKYIDDSRELWQGAGEPLPIATVGCAIGAHVGPGAVAVAFFEN